MVLVDSRGISRVPRYSGTCPASPHIFRLRGCHPLWPLVPERSTRWWVGNSPAFRPNRPYNPNEQARWFGLDPRSLAATSGVTDLFSFPAGTEMVHFPAFA